MTVNKFGSVHDDMVTIVGNGHGATWVQFMDETVCISHSADGKVINPFIVPPGMGK